MTVTPSVITVVTVDPWRCGRMQRRVPKEGLPMHARPVLLRRQSPSALLARLVCLAPQATPPL